MMTLFIIISLILFEDSHARLSCYYPSDCSKNCSENSVCATIQKGQELILTYNLAPNNLNWITCTWSRYIRAVNWWERKLEYCVFADLTQSQRVKKLICEPSDLMEKTQMEYIATTKSKCEIKVGNIGKRFEKESSAPRTISWRVSLDTDRDEKTITIRLRGRINKSMESNSVRAGNASTNALESLHAFDKHWNVAAIILLIIVALVVLIGEVIIWYKKYRLKEGAMKS